MKKVLLSKDMLALLKAIGIDPHITQSVTIHMDINSPVIIETKQLLYNEHTKSFVEVFSKYQLIEK